MKQNDYMRLAKIEAVINAHKAELDETIMKAYTFACERQDKEEAAALARKIRNRLLDNSDKEMSLDRLGLDASSTIGFIASLVKVFSGKWAKYRQELRDLTKQEGFPFDVRFPKSPNETDTN